MPSNKIKIHIFLTGIGFSEKDSIYEKKYHQNNRIIINLQDNSLSKCKIDWGEIKTGRKTTSNLHQQETLVVIECVDRLLSLGYPSSSITLEKAYSIATSNAYLDICVSEPGTSDSYLLIECKVYGRDFEKEKTNLLKDENGGELFGYFTQDRKAKFLILYTSRFLNESVESKYLALDTEDLSGQNKLEIHRSWNKTCFETGVFDIDTKPFEITEKKLLARDLKPFSPKDSMNIFNDFEEILRNHAISDKPNAFNKIFNLFVCKAYDEEKGESEILDFQWASGEQYQIVIQRLRNLFKKGMEQFLGIEVETFSQNEMDKLLGEKISGNRKDEINKYLSTQMLFKENEFAFKEVINKKTFEENALILKEVVKLLEKFKLRYESRQQFMGDFFEKLLNTSIKQEAGQYFTPGPICRFINLSLPIEETIHEKIENHEDNFLPYMVDYSSGSGHFLIEYLERVNTILKIIDPSSLRSSAKNNFNFWQTNSNWASTFIFGIEKDYRLAKTSKVGCILYGSPSANIIHGDGLDNFFESKVYRGILKSDEDKKELNKFDFVMANPPYSVKNFKKTTPNVSKSFDFENKLSLNSDDIECLFVERTIQLLKEGGCAGVILPSGFFSNKGAHSELRKYLLRKTEIKALVGLGNKTFMDTGENTFIIFFKKKLKDIEGIKSNINYVLNDASNKSSPTSKLIDDYLLKRFDLTLNEFKDAIDNIKENEELPWLNDYLEDLISEDDSYSVLKKNILHDVKDGILYFILSADQEIILEMAPESASEQTQFLGYSFSKRRGETGIKLNKDQEGNIKSKLFSESGDGGISKRIKSKFIDNTGSEKDVNLSTLINFDNNSLPIMPSLLDLNKRIENFKSNLMLDSESEIIRIKDLPGVRSFTGVSRPQEYFYYENGKNLFVTVEALDKSKVPNNKDGILDNPGKLLNEKGIKENNLGDFVPAGTILFPKSGQTIKNNRLKILLKDAYIVNHLMGIYIPDEDIRNYVFEYLNRFGTSPFAAASGYSTIKRNDILNAELPYNQDENKLKKMTTVLMNMPEVTDTKII
tara:strand:+ start:653 stop:3796 length:3144 start_codon:yes stop_codon:yes gene_type:complete